MSTAWRKRTATRRQKDKNTEPRAIRIMHVASAHSGGQNFKEAEKRKGNLLAGNRTKVFTCEINRQHQELSQSPLHRVTRRLFSCSPFKNLISKNNSKDFQEEQGIGSGASHKRLTSSRHRLCFHPPPPACHSWGSGQGLAELGGSRPSSRRGGRASGPLPTPPPHPRPAGPSSAPSSPPKGSINPKKGVTDRGILRFLPRHPPLGWRSAWYGKQSQIVDWTQGIRPNTSNLDF
ncbi:uncharacterized protein LOC119870969 [Canis lupus familiaris]|uniref:uncharacterized protein LOC119870969 n=1 Tax=Canis lupus familiaris TaxID=9615 RepID=UPI0018F3BE53|nr:uncharacterized protein LOC119870969 [Canis lupus familiaris]